MVQAIATEEDFSIQYDDTIACDVCKEVRHNFMDQVFSCCLISYVERRWRKQWNDFLWFL